MSDFARFGNIFGFQRKEKQTTRNSGQKRKRTSPVKKSVRRKPLKTDASLVELSVSRRSLNRSLNSIPSLEFRERITPPQPKFNSPDKKNILQHLSCNLEEFSKEPKEDAGSDENDLSQSFVPGKEETTIINPDIYSPEIENFSEGEDLFDVSQEGHQITKINYGIAESYQQRPKYKPINKVPKPGGLMEKLRMMKSKRLSEGCHYAKSGGEMSNQRKIEISEYCDYRRRLLLGFRFIDDLELPDADKAETHHYMVVSKDFHQFIERHTIYDVIFDLPKREFISNHFLHFGKSMKAARFV